MPGRSPPRQRRVGGAAVRARELMRQFGAADVWEDLSMREYDVLYTLSKCPDPIRLSELNRHVLLSQPALSRMVDRLAERGLVSRTTDPSDGRGVRLALTADGGPCSARIGRRPRPLVARSMLAGLTPAELRQLRSCARSWRQPARSTDRADHCRAGASQIVRDRS